MKEEDAVEIANPDEILLEDDEEPVEKAANPDEIAMDDEEDVGEGVQSEEKGGACACEGVDSKDHVEMEVDTTTMTSHSIVPDTAAVAVEENVAGESSEERTTKFLALSKPGGNRDFLQVSSRSRCSSHPIESLRDTDSNIYFQIIDIPEPAGYERPIPASTPSTSDATPVVTTDPVAEPTPSASALPPRPPSPPPAAPKHIPKLYFDSNWLAIIRTFNPFLSLRPSPISLPPKEKVDSLLKESIAWVEQNIGVGGLLGVNEVQKFGKTAPATGDGQDNAMRESLSPFLLPS